MNHERACANETGLPDGVKDRLATFAEWTGTTPPSRLTSGEEGERPFSEEFLDYAETTGLSLDWLWSGDVRRLVMDSHLAIMKDPPCACMEKSDPARPEEFARQAAALPEREREFLSSAMAWIKAGTVTAEQLKNQTDALLAGGSERLDGKPEAVDPAKRRQFELLRDEAYKVHYLIKVMDRLSMGHGQLSNEIDTLIGTSLPLSQKVANDLDKLLTY